MKNFKVKCVAYNGIERNFTVGRVYDVKGDTIISDSGYEYTAWASSICGDGDFHALKTWFSNYYTFELVNHPKPEKIVITHDGKTTTATLYRPDGTKKVATAACHPDDDFDFKVGAKLVVERLNTPEPPKYYNGKVVCVKSGIKGVTVGKVYTFVDGMCKSDRGNEMVNAPVKSVEELNCCFCSIEFIEIVE